MPLLASSIAQMRPDKPPPMMATFGERGNGLGKDICLGSRRGGASGGQVLDAGLGDGGLVGLSGFGDLLMEISGFADCLVFFGAGLSLMLPLAEILVENVRCEELGSSMNVNAMLII